MKNTLKKIVSIFSICCVLIANFYVPKSLAAESKTFGQIKDELKKYEKEMEDNKIKQQLTEEEKKKTKENIEKIEIDISDNQKQIYDLEQEINLLNEEIAKKEAEIDDILRFYEVSSGESAYLEYVFGAKSFTDFIYRSAVSEQLTSYNDSLVKKYQEDIRVSQEKTEELNEQTAKLKQNQKALEDNLKKISNDLISLSDDALSIESQIDLIKEQVRLFESMGCKNEETMEECAHNLIPPDTSFARPLETGYISGYPGYRCILGSCSTHHGLDMSASRAAYVDYPVYPVANGIVIATVVAKVNGGNKVYIQHNVNGKFYVSAYWHLRRVDVKKDQVVTKSTQIGIMGGTESWDEWTTGAHLHLELSTSDFTNGNIYSIRSGWLHPEYYINFPNKGVTWYNKTTRY